MTKFNYSLVVVVMVLAVVSVAAQPKSKHRKHKRIPPGNGYSVGSWEPEEGSAFLVYTKKLPVVTKIELRQITKRDNQIQILSSRTLLGDEAERFATMWRRLKRGPGAGCFVPAYNLRFFSNESLALDTQVCFGCDNITLPDGAANKQWGFDGRGPEGQALLAVLKFLL